MTRTPAAGRMIRLIRTCTLLGRRLCAGSAHSPGLGYLKSRWARTRLRHSKAVTGTSNRVSSAQRAGDGASPAGTNDEHPPRAASRTVAWRRARVRLRPSARFVAYSRRETEANGDPVDLAGSFPLQKEDVVRGGAETSAGRSGSVQRVGRRRRPSRVVPRESTPSLQRHSAGAGFRALWRGIERRDPRPPP